MLPDGFVYFVRDAFVAARSVQSWDGHGFQSAIAQIGRARKGLIVQGPGEPRFFGRRSASGLQHEIDTGLQARTWVGLVEVKATSNGPTKNDAMIFDGKTFDLYVDRLLAGRPGPHFRAIVSARAIAPGVSAFFHQRGIVCVEPDLIPLPVLIRLLEGGDTDRLFDDVEMQEADRLFGAACGSMETVWRLEGHSLSIRLRRFSPSDLDDLRYLHARMTAAILDRLTVNDPGWESRHLLRLGVSSSDLLLSSRVA